MSSSIDEEQHLKVLVSSELPSLETPPQHSSAFCLIMSNPPPDAGSKRAADFNEALLDMPGYADDTIFFLVRYIERCKVVLSSPFTILW